MNFNKNIGMLLLAVYLIAIGIISVFKINLGPVPWVVSGVSGIFILIGK